MMRKFGFLALLLILCMSGAALAQDSMPTYCGDLSQADCTIITNAKAATKTLDSASFDLTVNTTITNAPNMTGPATIGVTGNGSYSGVAALRNADMMAAMQTDPGAFFTNFLSNFDGDLTLTVNLPPEAVKNDPSMPTSLTLQLRLVNGFGYINFDTLQPLLAQMGPGMNLKGWGGLDLASLLKAALQQMPDMFKNMQAMNGGMDMSSTMQQFSDPNVMKQFVTIKRTDTGTGDTATFETTVNLTALMAMPQMQDMMRQRMQTQGQTMTQAQIDQAMAMSSQMFQNMTITVDEQIGLSDSFVHSIHAVINFDTSAMMASMSSMDALSGTPTPVVTGPAPVVNIDFTINYSNFNSAPAITAPANAMILPWQTLLGIEMTPEATMESTAEMTSTVAPTATQAPSTEEPTQEMTAEPTSEITAEPTSEMTTEPTTVPATVEPTVEVTAGS